MRKNHVLLGRYPTLHAKAQMYSMQHRNPTEIKCITSDHRQPSFARTLKNCVCHILARNTSRHLALARTSTLWCPLCLHTTTGGAAVLHSPKMIDRIGKLPSQTLRSITGNERSSCKAAWNSALAVAFLVLPGGGETTYATLRANVWQPAPACPGRWLIRWRASETLSTKL